MRLRPVDVHEQTFRMTFRGFDPVEVDGFLNRVADEMERLLEERVDLEMELETERAARNELETTLSTANHLQHSIIEKAKEDARVTLHQAKLLAERLGVETRDEIAGLRRDIAMLKERKATYLAEIGALSAAISKWVDRVEQGEREKAPLDQVADQEPFSKSFTPAATQAEVPTEPRVAESMTDDSPVEVKGEYEERNLTVSEPEYESFPTAFSNPKRVEEVVVESEEGGYEEYYQEDGPEEGYDDYDDELDAEDEAIIAAAVEGRESDEAVVADEPGSANGSIFRLAVDNVNRLAVVEEVVAEEVVAEKTSDDKSGAEKIWAEKTSDDKIDADKIWAEESEEEADAYDLTEYEMDGDEIEEVEVFDADSDLIDEALEILDAIEDDPDDDNGRG